MMVGWTLLVLQLETQEKNWVASEGYGTYGRNIQGQRNAFYLILEGKSLND